MATNRVVSRGFHRKREDGPRKDRIPPGQYETRDFPVLSTGPTPRISTATWSFVLEDAKRKPILRCSWDELLSLPSSEVTVDIHCVTKWSKLGTRWKGVSFDQLLAAAGHAAPTRFVTAFCDGGYTTNHQIADLEGGKGMIAYEYDGKPLEAEHGGPARLLVPHLYFWKSAKWIRGLRFTDAQELGFWETHGYHERGDPWQEERYAGD
jgi:DMSO/TMAO reductase YedYZ molybdopterin-dependent catalytic subunit